MSTQNRRKTKKRQTRIEEIKIGTGIAVAACAITLTVYECNQIDKNMMHKIAVKEANKPLNEEVFRIVNASDYRVRDEHGIDRGFGGYNSSILSGYMMENYNDGYDIGNIYLATLSKYIDLEYINKVVASLDSSIVEDCRDFMTYINMLGYSNVKDFQNAMAEQFYEMQLDDGKEGRSR